MRFPDVGIAETTAIAETEYADCADVHVLISLVLFHDADKS